MNVTEQAIGIFGGTFDPVHFGHLDTAIELYQQLPLAEIRFLPCQQPVHKAAASASAEHRLNMLKLAIANYPDFTVDTRELERSTPSYMYETLYSIRQEIGSNPLVLICSLDAFASFTYWYRWQELLNLAHLVVATRGGYQAPNLTDFFNSRLITSPSQLLEKPAGYLYFAQTTPITVSSTDIRQRVKANLPISNMLPQGVIDYIDEHQLYKI